MCGHVDRSADVIDAGGGVFDGRRAEDHMLVALADATAIRLRH